MKLTKESLLNLIKEEMDKIDLPQEVESPAIDTPIVNTVEETPSTNTIKLSSGFGNTVFYMISHKIITSALIFFNCPNSGFSYSRHYINTSFFRSSSRS